MPQQDAPAGTHRESCIHRLYRHVFELFLLLFLAVAGVEFLLEKAEPVVNRWNVIVKDYTGEDRVQPRKTEPADPPANICPASGGANK